MEPQKRKNYFLIISILSILVLITGYIFNQLPVYFSEGHNRNFNHHAILPSFSNGKNSSTQKDKPHLVVLFDKAISLLNQKKYSDSLSIWHEIIKIDRNIPEAHANLGFVMFELNRLKAAENSFTNAIELKPQQANAYWGLALVFERQEKIPEAIGAMRAFIHLSNNDEFKRKARSALWEWQTKTQNNNNK